MFYFITMKGWSMKRQWGLTSQPDKDIFLDYVGARGGGGIFKFN